MKDFKSVAKTMWFHTRILLNGFVKTLYGASTAGLIAMAVYGFWMIPTEGGYTAVCEFIGATATTVVALCSMYVQGTAKKKGAKR